MHGCGTIIQTHSSEFTHENQAGKKPYTDGTVCLSGAYIAVVYMTRDIQ
jgi:hypothetical protein